MTTVVSLLLIIAAGAFVAWPFFQTEASWRDAEPDTLSPLERQKTEAYTALKEAEFDWRTGKLSEADYAVLQEKYRGQAIAAIAAIEDARTHSRREKKAPGARPPRRIAFCPACGHAVSPRSNFCASCGQSLRERVA
jgi:rRNA maturation endonuclease Nob1